MLFFVNFNIIRYEIKLCKKIDKNIQREKYWNVFGRIGERILNINAKRGIESVKTILLPISSP